MTKHRHTLRSAGWIFFSLAGIALLACGCSKKPEQHTDEAKTRITQLGVLYGRFSSTHQGKGPANEQEFKEYRLAWM